MNIVMNQNFILLFSVTPSFSPLLKKISEVGLQTAFSLSDVSMTRLQQCQLLEVRTGKHSKFKKDKLYPFYLAKFQQNRA